MIEIKAEVFGFFTAIVAGIVVRLCYQCIECFRNIFRHTLMWIEIEDIVFWIGTAIYLFVQIYYTTHGRVRWYFILGVVLGVVISTFFLRKIKKVLKKIYEFHSGKNIAKKEKKRYYN